MTDPAIRDPVRAASRLTAAPPTSAASALAGLLRPRQWSKNGLLFVALVFSENLFEPALALTAFAAFLTFCALSSSVYVVNDWVDAERDRLHPTKRFRPIAAGNVSLRGAAVLAIALTAAGLGASFWINSALGFAALTYIGLSHFYSFVGKNVVILDVLLVASGFVIRAVAGALAIGVATSGWLIVFTLFAALFIALCKRKAELRTLQDAGAAHRPVLAHYSGATLSALISASMSAVLMSYALYVIDHRGGASAAFHPLELTLPFVLYGVFRYYWLVETAGEGGSPELLLLSDRGLRAAVVGFALVAVASFYGPW